MNLFFHFTTTPKIPPNPATPLDYGRKLDNPNNPADIYLQLVKKHHCPKSTEGTPRTLTDLKIYWQLLDWDKHLVLIFYEDAIFDLYA